MCISDMLEYDTGPPKEHKAKTKGPEGHVGGLRHWYHWHECIIIGFFVVAVTTYAPCYAAPRGWIALC